MANILMISLNRSFLNSIKKTPYLFPKDLKLYVFEEEDIVHVNLSKYKDPKIEEVRLGSYQQKDDYINLIKSWNKEVGFDLVLPGSEYSIKAVHTISNHLKINSFSNLSVESFTNKIDLRNNCKQLNIKQPGYKQIRSENDLYNCQLSYPIVLKPANRQASMGVLMVQDQEDIKEAWKETQHAIEDKKVLARPEEYTWDYIAEEFINGKEFSMESIVSNGEIIFNNITAKETLDPFQTNYFTETGHTVPAEINLSLEEDLINCKRNLITGLEFNNGLLHSEWKVNEKGAYLIECAMRAPGDKIPELIMESYGFDIHGAMCSVLLGKKISVLDKARYVSTIQFFQIPSGVLKKINGLSFIKNHPNVIDYDLEVGIGDNIKEISNSWARKGYFILKDKNHRNLRNAVDKIFSKLSFSTEENKL